MRFGFYTPNSAATGDPKLVVELAMRAETAGWDGFFLWDHLTAWRPPLADPWVMLGAVAACTERITLGPLIVPLARRRPQKVALEATTLTRLAPGRCLLGVGLGVPGGLHEVRRGCGLAGAGDQARKRALAVVRESLPDLPVWVGGEWPRRRPFHGAALVDRRDSDLLGSKRTSDDQ